MKDDDIRIEYPLWSRIALGLCIAVGWGLGIAVVSGLIWGCW